MAREALARRGLWTRVMAFLGLEDDEEEGAPAPDRPARGERPSEREGRLLVSLPGGRAARGSGAAEEARGRLGGITLFEPRAVDDVQEMVDRLKHRGPIVIQLDQADREAAQRILNFLTGALYALEGTMYALSPGVFLLVPSGVHVSDLRSGAH